MIEPRGLGAAERRTRGVRSAGSRAAVRAVAGLLGAVVAGVGAVPAAATDEPTSAVGVGVDAGAKGPPVVHGVPALHSAHGRAAVAADESSLQAEAGVTLKAGGQRLGYTIGLRHEHTRPES